MGSGGGGAGGNSSTKLTRSGGGVWNQIEGYYYEQDYTSPATNGADCKVTNINDGTSLGGKGASGGGQPRSGNGGNGGLGGISGPEGLFKSIFLDESKMFDYDENYSLGRDSDTIRCFP